MAVAPSARAQRAAFDSRSDGSDGALDYTGQTGTIDFNPYASNPVLDPDGDQVFHFTTITIPSGVTLRLRSEMLPNGPVYWLATGAVNIAGTIDLSGRDGLSSGTGMPMELALPGPGGFPGGFSSATPTTADGFGPGGGKRYLFNGISPTGSGGGFGTTGAGQSNFGGATYGNQFLIPLIGGSGGGGEGAIPGAGGGGGGGAITIASSESIAVGGSISANGGRGGNPVAALGGGGGSGGAIRLLAPTISGGGTVLAEGGPRLDGTTTNRGGQGRIRIEASSIGLVDANLRGLVAKVPLVPSTIFLPTDEPRLVRITSIAGMSVPNAPMGSVFSPDVNIDQTGPVSIELAARQIPLGTIVTLYIWSDTDGMQTIQSTPLAGMLESSTATAQATFSAGVTRLFVRAKWTP